MEPRIRKSGFQIIAVSPDLPELVKQTADKLRLPFPMLSDGAMTAAAAFGVAFSLDEKRYRKYIEYGADLEVVSGEKHHLLPVPSVFLLGTDRTIKFEYVNPNYKVRLAPGVLLAAVKAAGDVS